MRFGAKFARATTPLFAPENIMELKPGALWFQRSTTLPPEWALDAQDSTPGWQQLASNLNRLQLQQDLAASGWTFFFLSESISATAFGFNRGRMVETALARMASAMTRLFGIPYTRTHPRHMQRGALFTGE